MAKAQEAEPNERAASSPRRSRRQHVINLCCAQSVHRVVEEAARSLESLGFQVAVVCGAEARAALLGSEANSDQPTIHVVCVQGSMQERVLQPLRQALASHGGPNHHLFVAVLDLEVPLAMVGQIRRFAEGLEGEGASQGGLERAAPLEQEMAPTRTYPSVARVPERLGTKPPSSADGEDRPRRSRSLGARGRAAKVAPTAKYQAITANHPIVPQNDTRVHKRRRERSRLSPSGSRPAPASRVLGLPEDVVREDSGPLLSPTPPPPPTGETRRRSSTTIPSVSSSPPPPPSRSTSSSPARGSGRDGAARGGPVQKASARSALAASRGPRSKPEPEPDRIRPRTDAGFRFTPPGAKQAEERPAHRGAVTRVPLAEVLDDADRTKVQGVLEEVPRTASTLRLDEPPFGDGTRGRGEADEDEPAEPTMIMRAPVPARVDKTVAGPAPAPTYEKTVVGPAPGPGPAPSSEKTAVGPAPGPAPSSEKTAVGPAPGPSPTAAPSRDSSSERADSGLDSIPVVLGLAPAIEIRTPITLEPEDRLEPEEELKPKKTFLYGDSVGAKAVAAPAASTPAEEPVSSSVPSTPAPIDEPPAAIASAASEETSGPEPPPRAREPDVTPSVSSDEREPRSPARPRTRAKRSSSSSYGWLWTLLLLLGGGVGWGAFQAGLFGGGGSPSGDTKVAQATVAAAGGGHDPADAGSTGDDTSTKSPTLAAGVGSELEGADTVLSGSTAHAEPMAVGSTGGLQTSGAGTTGDTGDAETSTGSTAEPEPESMGSTGGEEPLAAESTGGEDDGGLVAVAGSAGSADDGIGDEEPEAPAAQLSAEEQQLGTAVDERRIFMLKTLFTTKRVDATTTFAAAWRLCGKLEVDGVEGWRLPHRREMKLVNAVLSLPAGSYWTRTVPDEDKESAYVLDSRTGALTLSSKQESGEIVCVRRRDFPER